MHKFVDDGEAGDETEGKDNTFYTHLREECGASQLWQWFRTTWREQWTKTLVKAVQKKTQMISVCVCVCVCVCDVRMGVWVQ